MIRFVDLRGQDIGSYQFAFWDTVTDKFITVGSDQAWRSIADLEEGAKMTDKEGLLPRLKGLCPDWASDPGEQRQI